jgi:hypothetical protein
MADVARRERLIVRPVNDRSSANRIRPPRSGSAPEGLRIALAVIAKKSDEG